VRAIIFSHEANREIDGVIDRIRNVGVEVRRFNLCQFPRKLHFSISNEARRLSEPDECGWIHNVGEFSFARELVGLDREVGAKESEAMLEGVFERHHCTWLNSPKRIRAAANKPNQLLVAAKIGMPVPDYLITNDVAEVRDFAAKHSKVVTKALSVSFLHYGSGDPWKFYTQLVDPRDTFEGLQYAPQMFQEAINRSMEVRVTVVDGKCYSVGIDCHNLAVGLVDVRQLDYAAERHRFFVPTDLEMIENLSLKMANELDLGYAALDWAVDAEDRSYFFEVNACGSFKWFEQCGAGDITGAISEAILIRCNG